EYCPNTAARIDNRIRWSRVERDEVGNRRIFVGWEKGVTEVASLIVVSCSKARSGDDRQPAKIGIRIKDLVESIEPRGAIIIEAGTGGDTPAQIRNPGFALDRKSVV